jgi:dienelactone hydrolase
MSTTKIQSDREALTPKHAKHAEPVADGPVVHGFLEGPRPVFATYHAPRGPGRNIAYVVCPPLHFDLIQCYRSMRVLAERLAGAGFHAVRVAYDGSGESAGEDEDPGRVAAWLSSVRRAAAALLALPGVDGVGLVGVRIGATFAAEVASQIEIGHLVLWEPSVGSMYGREMEILAASAPSRPSPDGAAAATASDAGFVAGGYWLSRETLDDLAKLDPERVAPKGKPSVLLLHRSDRRPSAKLKANFEKHGCEVLQEQHAGYKEMMVLPQKSVVPTEVLARIEAWALERSRAASGTPPRLALAPRAEVNGITWRPIRFGKTGHLFGVLTEPSRGWDRRKPVLLLLTGGVVPRMSGNGSYVKIARKLAARGHAVLRMDVAFIGESGTPDGSEGNPNDAYPPSIVADAREGAELLFERTSANAKMWVAGLCSGAYASFQTMLAERRVVGAFLINPLVFHTSDGGLGARAGVERPMAMTAVQQLQEMNRYKKVALDPAAWKKLLSGKVDVRHIAKLVTSRASAKVRAKAEALSARLGRKPAGVPGEIWELQGRGVKVNFAISEGDAAEVAVRAELGPRYEELIARGMVVRTFEAADHNFNERASQRELIDWMVAEISP